LQSRSPFGPEGWDQAGFCFSGHWVTGEDDQLVIAHGL
jgi:hypothetical protein